MRRLDSKKTVDRQTINIVPFPLVQFTNFVLFFFFNDTATTEIYTLSLHDALPIFLFGLLIFGNLTVKSRLPPSKRPRSEEHTSELQSLAYLVCRLLLEKKKHNSKEFFQKQLPNMGRSYKHVQILH